jgi:uncharacterized membrane protein YgcG
MKRLATGLMVLGTLVSTAVNSSARAAEVRLAWEGQAADARLVELANGEQGVIEVYVDDLAADDSLSGMFFSNEFAAGLAQVGAATVLAGWDSSSIPGTALGEGGQQVIYSSPTADANIFGPGSILVGTFTVEVQSGNPGDEFEIAFDLDFISVVDATAIFYQITATGSAVQDSAGRFHLGAGSPGYARMGITDERDPLIVRVKESSSGGGGGGGGTGGGGGSSGGGDDPEMIPEMIPVEMIPVEMIPVAMIPALMTLVLMIRVLMIRVLMIRVLMIRALTIPVWTIPAATIPVPTIPVPMIRVPMIRAATIRGQTIPPRMTTMPRLAESAVPVW